MKRNPAVTRAGFPVAPCLVVLVACGSHMEGLRRAAADLEGSAAAGMSYSDLGQKLQNFGSAIVLAKDQGVGADDLRPYEKAFDMYKDSYDLWKLKIDCPVEFGEVNGSDCSWVGRKVDELAAEYGLPPVVKQRSTSAFTPFEERYANKNAFDKLMRIIWEKAAQTAKKH
jgi:hypothetical protein